jgi:hypothetical protein
VKIFQYNFFAIKCTKITTKGKTMQALLMNLENMP